MPSPNGELGLASLPAGGDMYFAGDSGLAAVDPGEPGPGSYATRGGTRSAAINLDSNPSEGLMYPGSFTPSGEAIADVSKSPSTRGHYSEIINFHGSPAPWILVGLLLVMGLMALEAKGRLGPLHADLEV